MAGAMGGGGGGGGSSSGSGSALSSTANENFNINADNTGAGFGPQGTFSADALNTGDAGASFSPAAIAQGQDPASQSLQMAEQSQPPPSGGQSGRQSGGEGGGDSILHQLADMLIGPSHAAVPSKSETQGLYNFAGGGQPAGAGWITTQAGGRTDPYGNTYTSEPGYQGMPTHPLPPYGGPSAGPAAAPPPASRPALAAAPAPAAAAPAAPAPAPAAPAAEAAVPAVPASPPAEPVVTTAPEPKDIETKTEKEVTAPPAPAPAPEVRQPGTEELPGAAAATPGVPAPVPAPAPVSPQSAPVSGNTGQQPSALERLIEGTGLGDLVRSIFGQQQSMMRGATTPTQMAIARDYMDPGKAAPLQQQIRAGDLLTGVPPQTASTAKAYQAQNRPGAVAAPAFPPVPGAPSATVAPAGTAPGAPGASRPPSTVQERAQWRAGYENWRTQNKLFDTPVNRERFNTERGYPAGSSSSPPAPGSAAPAPAPTAGQQARPPSYAEWLSARSLRHSDQNFIRFKTETGAWRTGAPQFSSTTEAAANVGTQFPRGDWQRFEREARPSTRVEDRRQKLPGEVEASGPELDYVPTAKDVARYNPNDPMTRALVGDKPFAYRPDVLRNMNPQEFRIWQDQMRRQLQQILGTREWTQP